jgi:hypothetical protein
MLSWSVGTFALEPEDPNMQRRLQLSAQAYLMEGFRQQDELSTLLHRAPKEMQRLGLRSPLEAPLQDLEQSKLEVLQAAINAPNFSAALDRSPKTDLETVKDVLDLLSMGVLEILDGVRKVLAGARSCLSHRWRVSVAHLMRTSTARA